jgi:hypothetical protein|tara:strand:- start:454 stop:591 length:138 start_codon:yes stop_codon:yes gene_type:complete
LGLKDCFKAPKDQSVAEGISKLYISLTVDSNVGLAAVKTALNVRS